MNAKPCAASQKDNGCSNARIAEVPPKFGGTAKLRLGDEIRGVVCVRIIQWGTFGGQPFRQLSTGVAARWLAISLHKTTVEKKWG